MQKVVRNLLEELGTVIGILFGGGGKFTFDVPY